MHPLMFTVLMPLFCKSSSVQLVRYHIGLCHSDGVHHEQHTSSTCCSASVVKMNSVMEEFKNVFCFFFLDNYKSETLLTTHGLQGHVHGERCEAVKAIGVSAIKRPVVGKKKLRGKARWADHSSRWAETKIRWEIQREKTNENAESRNSTM